MTKNIAKYKTKRRMFVKIKKTNCWYKKGEIHEVGCYISHLFLGNFPCYELADGYKGIHINDCNIIKILPK